MKARSILILVALAVLVALAARSESLGALERRARRTPRPTVRPQPLIRYPAIVSTNPR